MAYRSSVPLKGLRISVFLISLFMLVELRLAAKKRTCKHKAFPACYGVTFDCPPQCPKDCSIDCAACKPVCNCNKPGAVCMDPRFIGGDGITFYFHGKKDNNFCLLSDANLHINGHFIGKRVEGMRRDFTWVQSIGVLFDDHQLFLGAKKVAKWEENVDQLAIVLDGQPIDLPNTEGATWEYKTAPQLTITRTSEANDITVEVTSNFKIIAGVVPITEEESRIHGYEITFDDCFAHLDLSFKFYSLTDHVTGVLGQTYAPSYKSRVKMGVLMPVLGGHRAFLTSGLFADDCAVTRFRGSTLS